MWEKDEMSENAAKDGIFYTRFSFRLYPSGVFAEVEYVKIA